MERRSQQQIAKGDAEHERRNDAGQEKDPVPAPAPRKRRHFSAKGERDGPQDKTSEHKHHCQIEAREGGGIEQGPCGEDRAAAKNEPDLVSFPNRADSIEQHATLVFVSWNERMQHCDAQIESVHDGKTDKQHAKKRPPDHAQRSIVERHGSHSLMCRRLHRRR